NRDPGDRDPGVECPAAVKGPSRRACATVSAACGNSNAVGLGTARDFGHTRDMRYTAFGMSLVGSLLLVTSAYAEPPPTGAPVIKLLTAGKGPTRKLRI